MKIFLAILLFLFSSLSFAQQKLTFVTERWVPFNYLEKKQIVGISTELVKASLEHAGFNYDMQLLPWQRAYRLTLKNPNHFLFTTNRTRARENLFKWVGPLYNQDVSFYRLKNKKHIKVNKLGELRNYTIGVSRGGSIEGYLKEIGYIENQDYFTYFNEKQGEKMLLSGHIDLIPGSQFNLAHKRMLAEDSSLQLVKAFTLTDTGYYIAANINTDDEIINRLQDSLEHLIKNGLRQNVLERHFKKFDSAAE